MPGENVAQSKQKHSGRYPLNGGEQICFASEAGIEQQQPDSEQTFGYQGAPKGGSAEG